MALTIEPKKVEFKDIKIIGHNEKEVRQVDSSNYVIPFYVSDPMPDAWQAIFEQQYEIISDTQKRELNMKWGGISVFCPLEDVENQLLFLKLSA